MTYLMSRVCASFLGHLSLSTPELLVPTLLNLLKSAGTRSNQIFVQHRQSRHRERKVKRISKLP
jgi:hypothetical protein